MSCLIQSCENLGTRTKNCSLSSSSFCSHCPLQPAFTTDRHAKCKSFMEVLIEFTFAAKPIRHDESSPYYGRNAWLWLLLWCSKFRNEKWNNLRSGTIDRTCVHIRAWVADSGHSNLLIYAQAQSHTSIIHQRGAKHIKCWTPSLEQIFVHFFRFFN